MHTALTIAGSDSGGGAGIQADLKTFFRFGVFGTSAITAITAQNTLGVTMWEPVSSSLLRAQINAVASDIHPAAIKTGMVGTVKLIDVVADSIEQHELRPYVLDPVIIATSGDSLLETDGVGAIRDRLLPLATLVTPNSDEASALTGIRVVDAQSMKDAAQKLVDMGASAALVKGGHVTENPSTIFDVFFDGEFRVFSHSRIVTTSTHGTGCTLSAAITALLANGVSLSESVSTAIDYVHSAILSAPQIGSGRGPLNHFVGGNASTNERTTD